MPHAPLPASAKSCSALSAPSSELSDSPHRYRRAALGSELLIALPPIRLAQRAAAVGLDCRFAARRLKLLAPRSEAGLGLGPESGLGIWGWLKSRVVAWCRWGLAEVKSALYVDFGGPSLGWT